MSRRLNGHRHPSVAEDLINLGAIQHEQGRYAEAERFYRDALDITESWYGETHPRTAATLTVLARTLLFTPERTGEAVALLQRALAIQERVFGPVHPRVASTVNELGRVALGQDRPDEAAAYWTRMFEIYKSVYAGQDHYLVGIPLSNLASAAFAKRDYRGSERYMRDALDIFRATLPAGHSNIGIGHLKLGRALLRQQRFADARSELSAGYELLKPQMDNGSVWLQNARKDLAESYDGLALPAEAARFREEFDLAAAAKPAS
jgi:serine/threonine-protein kinase